ncbi:MAG: efflux RND transporter permease subunit [Tannerellaceae bacterium]|jgi:multidrug efflux pump subunit AcrB|nr:efflux RND transporter permease subunit [Tannerellaceae bacterium]
MSRFSVVLIFICIALAGIAFVPLLPVKLEPSHTLPKLTVSYSMPGHASRIIEIEVTSRLEAMLARIRGIREIRSTSGSGWGRITIELDRHARPDAIRFEASTIVRQAWSSLPEGLSYPVIEMSRPDDREARPFMSFVLNAASTPILIQQFAERRIKPVLAGIPGIYRVDITGATPMEWGLEYDSRQLAMLGIGVEDIRAAIARHHRKEALGMAQDESGQWIRLALAPEASTDGFDPSGITVMTPGNGPVALSRLIKVSRREETPSGYYRINGLNSVYLFINAEETANQLELASRINKEMKAVREMLPAGYEMHASYDATRFIRDELNKIYARTAMTIAILLLFVLLMMRSWRYLALIVVSLAVNICIAFIFYYLFRLEMQLYSLAGITISLSLIIDNVIVMSDHIRNKRNRNAFLPILAATLTTIGALCIVFFLDNAILLNLQDFTMVVIINLAVSLSIALFFIPALQPSLIPPKDKKPTAWSRALSRITVRFGRFYLLLIHFTSRWKALFCIALVLAFGLPVFMLPEKIEMKDGKKYSRLDSLLINSYNKAVSNPTYKEKIKPITDVALGGTLRPFAQNSYQGIYVDRKQETILSVTASMPNGTTLPQMNSLVRRMESYIGSHGKKIKQFQTRIFNAREARIDIFFTNESERRGFPYTLKQNIVAKALELGGGSWAVYGLPADQGFNNSVREFAGNYRVELLGYNYDELYTHAEILRDSLLANPRIREVIINHEFTWYKNDYQELFFQLDKRSLAAANLQPVNFFSGIRSLYGNNLPAGSIIAGNRLENLRLSSRQSQANDEWTLLNAPLTQTGLTVGHLAEIRKMMAPPNIAKLNQQYVLCLQYEYIGAHRLAERILERTLKELNSSLPLGYSAARADAQYYFGRIDGNFYGLLPVIILILYFISGILFNSLRQPLAIIFVIPISYIGVFIAFKQFRLHFDQGGFASFVLLCGITINAGIYILNEYNAVRRRKPLMAPARAYLKAWNAKTGPIFLTIISSVLGFMPFLIGMERENFWFSLAAGSISGLIASFAGIFLFLPMLCGLSPRPKRNPPIPKTANKKQS